MKIEAEIDETHDDIPHRIKESDALFLRHIEAGKQLFVPGNVELQRRKEPLIRHSWFWQLNLTLALWFTIQRVTVR